MKLDNTPLSVHRQGNKIPGTISIRQERCTQNNIE